MREMDPSKHIPIDDKIIEKDNCRSHWSQRFTLVMLMSIIYMFGLIYYMDFYNKGVENSAQEYGVVQPEDNMPIKNNAQDFERAKALIEEGMEKWENLDYVEYTAQGSDGDEVAYFQEYYEIDNVKEEIYYTRFDSKDMWCHKNEELSECEEFTSYIRKEGKFYRYEEGKKTLVGINDFHARAELSEVKDFITSFLNRDISDYDLDVNLYEAAYYPDNQAVTYVEINYFRKRENNALYNMFKAYADVTYDKISIEMIIDREGRILEVTVPHAYSEMKLYFRSYNEPVEIRLPE